MRILTIFLDIWIREWSFYQRSFESKLREMSDEELKVRWVNHLVRYLNISSNLSFNMILNKNYKLIWVTLPQEQSHEA